MTTAELYKLIQDKEYIHTDADIDYCFYTEGTTLYMLFQETTTKNDWKVNFDFPARMYKNMIIHRGYAKTFKSVKDELYKALFNQICFAEYTDFVFAGWSKGSTEAILMAEDFYYRSGIKPQCITYGGPKVVYTIGTRNYLRRIMTITEYVQSNDFVTKVIPFCFRLNKVKIGEKFNFKKILNTAYYHCNYDKVL